MHAPHLMSGLLAGGALLLAAATAPAVAQSGQMHREASTRGTAAWPGDVPPELQQLGDHPRVREAIGRHYARYAREGHGACGQLAMSEILSAPTIGWYRETDEAALAVNYAFASQAVQPGEGICRGIDTRVFTLKEVDGRHWRIVDMSGLSAG